MTTIQLILHICALYHAVLPLSNQKGVPIQSTVSLGATLAVVGTDGCGDGRIAPTRCTVIDAGLGGVIWGNDASDDHFVQSHGVATPDAFRKLIVRGQDRVIAWVIPNTSQATRSRLDEYLVTVDEFAQRTGETFPEAAESARSEKPEVSWTVPIGCDRG